MTNNRWFKYGLMALSASMLLGCATKLADAEDEKTLDYIMTKSKKFEIVHSPTSKTFVSVTYLNPISHDSIVQDSEKFIVGTYLKTSDGEFRKVSLSGFEINGRKDYVTVKPITLENPLMKLISSANEWSNYVLVEAPKTEQLKMQFSFENGHSQRVSAEFRKDF